ncbi:MAG: hypothetical protein R3E95_10240 [Thiolinea sp.]
MLLLLQGVIHLLVALLPEMKGLPRPRLTGGDMLCKLIQQRQALRGKNPDCAPATGKALPSCDVMPLHLQPQFIMEGTRFLLINGPVRQGTGHGPALQCFGCRCILKRLMAADGPASD